MCFTYDAFFIYFIFLLLLFLLKMWHGDLLFLSSYCLLNHSISSTFNACAIRLQSTYNGIQNRETNHSSMGYTLEKSMLSCLSQGCHGLEGDDFSESLSASFKHVADK